MKIRAAVLRETGLPLPHAQSRPLHLEAHELAAPGFGEVLVKICAAVALYKAGKLSVDRLLSERLALPDINAALGSLARGESIRQVVLMDAA